jgi:hypothetical protein
MSFLAKGAGNRQLNLCIPDLIAGLIRLDTLVLDDPKGICLKGLPLFRAEEDEFHSASLNSVLRA